MADIDRFHESYAYLADKPDLDVTEAMGFNHNESRFVLVTKETTSTKIRGITEAARVIALVTTNNLAVSGSDEERTSTELYAITPQGFDTDYGTLYEYGINGEVLDIHRHTEEDVLGTQFEQTIVPKQSTDISHESAFMIIEQAIKAHQAGVSDIPKTVRKNGSSSKLQARKPTLLDAAKAKITEEERIRREEALNAQENAQEKARIEATLKHESDANAKEFINLMRSHAVPTRKLFLQIKKSIRSEKNGYNYEGGYDYTNWYRVETSKLGVGWILRENNFTERNGNKVERGLMLLSDGNAYEYDSRSTKPGDYYIEEYSGPVLNGELHAWTSPLVAPFAGNGASLLVDAIIKYGIDKPASSTKAK